MSTTIISDIATQLLTDVSVNYVYPVNSDCEYLYIKLTFQPGILP